MRKSPGKIVTIKICDGGEFGPHFCRLKNACTGSRKISLFVFPISQFLEKNHAFFRTLLIGDICDVIKQNQSEVRNIDFKIELNKAENVFCFLLFLASFNCSYLWNQLNNFNGVFCKM